MRIFWYCHSLFPAAREIVRQRPTNGCGWQLAYARDLLQNFPQAELAVAGVYEGEKEIHQKIDNITYYLIPCVKIERYSTKTIASWRRAIADFRPDIIHLHGTEYPAGYALLQAVKNIPVVASIQGLVHACSLCYTKGMTWSEIATAVALRDLIRPSMTWLPFAKLNMKKRGDIETRTLRQLRYVIGRTDWDRSYVLQCNPDIHYLLCNESLRSEFYQAEKWRYDKCHKHTVFASSSAYPLKGAHQLIRAMASVVRQYPDTQLRIVGTDVLHLRSLKDYLRLTGYALYLRRLIKKFHLQRNIQFTGTLTASKMIEEFLNCNCYVLASAIENSPNSLGEAQILGVPAIASNVGGIPSMVTDGVNGLLYQYEDVAELAQKIIRAFQAEEKIGTLGKNAITAATIRHDKAENAKTLIAHYRKIIQSFSNSEETTSR